MINRPCDVNYDSIFLTLYIEFLMNLFPCKTSHGSEDSGVRRGGGNRDSDFISGYGARSQQ